MSDGGRTQRTSPRISCDKLQTGLRCLVGDVIFRSLCIVSLALTRDRMRLFRKQGNSHRRHAHQEDDLLAEDSDERKLNIVSATLAFLRIALGVRILLDDGDVVKSGQVKSSQVKVEPVQRNFSPPDAEPQHYPCYT